MVYHRLKVSQLYKVFVITGILLVIILNALAIFAINHNMNKVSVDLVGNTSLIANINEDYEDPGINVNRHGKEVKYEVKEINNIDTSKFGTYTYEYEINVDGKEYKLVRTVEVVDKSLPVITVEEKELIRDYCSKTVSKEPTYKAIDNYDGDITDKVEKKDNGSEYILSVVDSNGNENKVTIPIKDQEEPKNKIVLNGYKTQTVTVGTAFNDKGAKVYTGCGIELPNEKVTVEGTVDTNTIGTYELVYKNDKYNISEKRTVYVTKKTEPVIEEETETPGNGKVIYLTFDDGPGGYTKQFLDILDKYNAKATFFVTNQFPNYQWLIGEEARRGHTVAVHSLTHNWNIYNSVDAYKADFNAMNDIIEQQTGKRSNIFRFPGGSSNTVSRGHQRGIMTTLSQVMQSEGYQYFDWNVDSNDAGGANSTQIYNNVIRGIKKTSKPVILMHDIKKTTLNALDDMLRYMTNNGYKFGTLDLNGPIVHHGINN